MPSYILVSSDLMFISKVKEVALASGSDLRTVRSPESLQKAVGESAQAGVVMIDLERASIPLEALSITIAELTHKGWRVVSFYSHVHEELSSQANRLGLGEVVPRSRFVKLLPELF
jgi:hypothetical protein